jgi:transcriptional regulator with XRE-family HTH domain
MTFGTRLKEERKRLGLQQAAFAERVGTDVPKQSLYETGKRELRGAYLSRIAEAGVDVRYVLTGQRSQGAWLDPDTAKFLSDFLALPPQLREAVRRFMARP